MYSKSTYDGGKYNVPESYGGVAFGSDRVYRPLTENVAENARSERPDEAPRKAERPPELPFGDNKTGECSLGAETESDCKHGRCGEECAKRPESRFSLDLSGDDILLAVIILLLRDGEKNRRGGESCDDVIMLLLLLMFLH